MKTKELMIGDWVSLKSCPKPNFYKISKLDPNMESSVYPIHVERPAEGLSYTFLDEDEIEPIPLTAEILEKNGFVEGEFVKVGYKEIKLENHYFTFNHPKYDIEVWEGELFLMRLYNLNSVHELQHVLRLCGITKEIII